MSQIIKNLAAGPVPPSVATSYQAQTNGVNTGVAVPAANILTLNGMDGVAISGSGSTLTFTGILTYTNVTGPTTYVANATDYFISVDSTLGNVTIQLPNAPTKGREFIVKDRQGQSGMGGGHTIAVTTPGGAVTIDGQTTYTFTDNYESIDVVFNGSNYEVF